MRVVNIISLKEQMALEMDKFQLELYIFSNTGRPHMKTLMDVIHHINEVVSLKEAVLYANIEIRTSTFPDKAIAYYSYMLK